MASIQVRRDGILLPLSEIEMLGNSSCFVIAATISEKDLRSLLGETKSCSEELLRVVLKFDTVKVCIERECHFYSSFQGMIDLPHYYGTIQDQDFQIDLDGAIYSVNNMIAISMIENVSTFKKFMSSVPSCEVVFHLLRVMKVIHQFHRLGWIHGDFHLENTLISPSYRIFLIDFGDTSSYEKSHVHTRVVTNDNYSLDKDFHNVFPIIPFSYQTTTSLKPIPFEEFIIQEEVAIRAYAHGFLRLWKLPEPAEDCSFEDMLHFFDPAKLSEEEKKRRDDLLEHSSEERFE